MNYYVYRAYILETVKAARMAALPELVKGAQRDLVTLRQRHYHNAMLK